MDSTIIKNQIVYRCGLDIFHNLSDFKVLVSDVKNIAENVGMNWRICFGLCPICDVTNSFVVNPASVYNWYALRYIKNGWQSSEENSEPTFVNLPSNFTLSSFSNNNPFFYSNIENINECSNNTVLMKWISFKQNLKTNITDIPGGQSYPYYSTDNDVSSPSYVWYAQRCSIIFYLAQKEDSNATFIIDCFNMYHKGGNSGAFYPNSFYQVATYGVRKNIDDSLEDWLTKSAINGNVYGNGFYNYETGESLENRADINFSCFLKYTYFCGKETTALSQLFFTRNFLSIYPQNRTIKAGIDGQPITSGNSKPVRNGTIATYFSKLYLGNSQEGFCVLSNYGESGESGTSTYNYIFCYSNFPWAIVYTINYYSNVEGTQVISIPSSSARKDYPYNGISCFKDFMGRYTPHLYKKFWGGRDLYDCFILEKADGTTKKMFGGSLFCIDFADEEET